MLKYEKRYVMGAQADCAWASKMVLNPAIVKDPENANVLHMLFRSTAAWDRKTNSTANLCPIRFFWDMRSVMMRGKTGKLIFLSLHWRQI